MTPTRSHYRHTRKFNLLAILLLAFGGLGLFAVPQVEAKSAQQPKQSQPQQSLMSEDSTQMGVPGGRARGGSFNRSAPPSSSGGSSRNSPGYGGGLDYGDGYSYPRHSYPPYYPGNGPVIVAPYPGGYGGYGGGYGTFIGPGIGFLFFMLVLGFTVLPLLLNLLRLRGLGSGSYGNANQASGELANDTVVVTQLQVALLAQARTLQSELADLTAGADLNSQEGLTQLLQETVLALLRSPEYWSHARVSSQVVRSREQASQIFEQLSIAERSKVRQETLVNVGGQVRRNAFTPKENADPAAYIVVTLLVGTADDRPLLDKPIYSANDLQAALQRLGAVSPDYLMIFELLWSPQDPSDSLSYDQLLEAYPNLTQIA